MGLLAKYKQFKQKRLEKAIAKNLKLVTNPKAIREDRVAAIDFFADLGQVEVAVPALLKRFDFSLEHGINDTREKEAALEGVVKFGAAAAPHIVDHLRESDRIAWPIKAFKQVVSDAEIVPALASCLDFADIAFDQAKVDKNYDILCYLRDYKLPSSLTHKLFHFLNDHDERVRFAVVETLIEQEDRDVPGQIERFLADDSPENTRIRQTVIDAFVKQQWTISDRQKFSEGPLTGGFKINKNFQLTNEGARRL